MNGALQGPAPALAMPALPPALPGFAVERWHDAACGQLACWRGGSGPPLVLVHSINAAASAAELRPLAERFSRTHTVYAPDLPGYGESERSARAYTVRLMTDALHALVARIRATHGERPVPALAVSLGCEFVARAAAERPAWYATLALVSPTGFIGTRARRAPEGRTRAVPGLHRVLALPGLGETMFRGLTRPRVVRYFLERTWGTKAIDETMCAQAVATARVPGAHHAPLHFLSGGLFSADIHDVYDRLVQPVWAVHGTRGDFTDYRGLEPWRTRANWRISVLEGGALMYFEDPARFEAESRGWPGGA